jgi:protein SCO1
LNVKGPLALVLAGALLTGCAHPTAPDFTLTSDNGTPWTLSAQHGKVVALFFGFSHCTDTCPDTLAKLAASLRADNAAPGTAQIAFVTIDPQRDTPSVMHAYITHFPGAPVVGLTGTPAQIAAVENAYHVWSQKIPAAHGDDYDEAHSAFTFLIDRNGDQRMIHNDDDPQRDFAADMATLLR